jgi:hypothetical protein
LVIALIAIAVATWALLRPAPEPAAAAPTAKEISDARARACGAYSAVSKAVSLQTHADLGTDPVALAAVAANARLAMSEGATYLLSRIDPATPDDVAEAARRFVDDLHSIAIGALEGHSNTEPAQVALLKDAEKTSDRLQNLCK